MFINIELKDDRLQLTFDKVIEVVEKYNMIEQIAFSSFKHGYYDIICHYCHEKNHQIEFGFLYHDKSKKEKFIPYRFDINGKVTMNIKYKEITKELVDKAHSKGYAVHCWFPMKDEETEAIYEKMIIYYAVIILIKPKHLEITIMRTILYNSYLSFY